MPKKWCSTLNPRLTLDTKEDYVFLKKVTSSAQVVGGFVVIVQIKMHTHTTASGLDL